MRTEIRQATADDVEPLIALCRRTISACYPSFLGAAAVESFINSGAADQYVRENIERCLTLVADRRVVGCAVTKENLIDLMMVDLDLHRRGLGTILLQHLEKMLFESHDTLVLETFAGNDYAILFYQKNGWIEKRRFADDASGREKIEFQKPKKPGDPR